MGPKVFISSTCHDFEEERTKIEEYIQNMGWVPVLSDGKFGVLPALNSHDACLAQLQRCDIVIIMIGCRYGGRYVRDESISITHKEFRVARELKIPMYILVRDNVMTDNDMLVKNNQDYSAINLDKYAAVTKDKSTSHVLEQIKSIHNFINEARRLEKDPDYTNRSNWVFRFTSTDTLLSILREQLAFLAAVLLDVYRSGVSKFVKLEQIDTINESNFKLIKKGDFGNSIVQLTLSELPIESTLLIWEGALCLPPNCYEMINDRVIQFSSNFTGNPNDFVSYTVRYEYTYLIK